MASIKIKQLKNQQPSKRESNLNGFLRTIMTKDISLGSKEFSDKKKANFYNDLNILLSSGIDLHSALILMSEETTNKDEKKVYDEIRKHVINGLSLSEATERTKKFSTYEYYSLRIGEETGSINDILKDLVSFYAKRIEQKRKMKSAFSYPLFVLFIAIIAVIFMMIFVVPMFQDVFARFGNELPYLTQVVINISDTLIHNSWAILSIVGGVVILFLLAKRHKQFDRLKSGFLLRIPFWGELVRKMYLSRFALAMSLLTSAHIPMLQALELVRKMITFYPIQSSLAKAEQDITKGKSLHESLSQFKIYDKRMLSLLKVGEEVNQLDIVFNRLKKQYMEDVDYQTSMANGIIEPLMIIVVGVFVGIILVSMYLPIFKLSTSFGY
ncbi:MAG: type II secretion system F family protein [Paludibacteraceae bacterium]|nr:type II secretion system F family protein [Paludibacteraceae bacterium]